MKKTRHQNLDGAYFGTTLAGIFFLTYPERIPQNSIVFPETSERVPRPKATPVEIDNWQSDSEPSEEERPNRPRKEVPEPPQPEVYEAKIFGFGVSEFARNGGRMGWLRKVPE
jgi:casein kinase II subunit beta